LWIKNFLTLHPQVISAVTKKKISSRFGSRINKSFFIEILKNLDQKIFVNFNNNKYRLLM